MPFTLSDPLPPRYVLNSKAVPVGVSFAMKPSRPPPGVGWAAFRVGKSRELVHPATIAEPELSTAIPYPRSSPLPAQISELAKLAGRVQFCNIYIYAARATHLRTRGLREIQIYSPARYIGVPCRIHGNGSRRILPAAAQIGAVGQGQRTEAVVGSDFKCDLVGSRRDKAPCDCAAGPVPKLIGLRSGVSQSALRGGNVKVAIGIKPYLFRSLKNGSGPGTALHPEGIPRRIAGVDHRRSRRCPRSGKRSDTPPGLRPVRRCASSLARQPGNWHGFQAGPAPQPPRGDLPR